MISTVEKTDTTKMTVKGPEAGVKPVETKIDVGGLLKKRYIQGYMMFFMFFMAYALRLNMSVAIVAMTDSKTANPDFEELDWDLKTRSKVLSSFFWGYLVIQLPAGQLGQMFSVKKLLLAANTSNAVLALLTPWAASRGGWFLVCVIRVLQGISQGFFVPLSITLASKWVPDEERNRFVGYFLNGGIIGAVVTLALSGLLASSSGGWPSVFYVSGTLGVLWSVVWLWVGADGPLAHTTIDERERKYILSNLQSSSQTEKYPTPWKSIFTSVPVWGLIGVSICNGWGYAIILTQLPAYISSVLGFDIKKNGLLSALPYVSLWICTFPACWLADFLGKRKLLSTVVIRKLFTTLCKSLEHSSSLLFTTLCLGGGSVMMLCMCLVERDAVVAITLITLSVTCICFMFSGFNMNYLDLSPNFAGVLMGLCNGLENVTTIIAPLSVGWLVSDPSSVYQWRRVFFSAAAVSLLGNAIYVLLGRADVQPWNSPVVTSKETEQRKVEPQVNKGFVETET